MIIKFDIDTDKPKSIVEAIQYLEQLADMDNESSDDFDAFGGEVISEVEEDDNNNEEEFLQDN